MEEAIAQSVVGKDEAGGGIGRDQPFTGRALGNERTNG